MNEQKLDLGVIFQSALLKLIEEARKGNIDAIKRVIIELETNMPFRFFEIFQKRTGRNYFEERKKLDKEYQRKLKTIKYTALGNLDPKEKKKLHEITFEYAEKRKQLLIDVLYVCGIITKLGVYYVDKGKDSESVA